MKRIKWIVGDTKTTLSAQLQQKDSNNNLANTDLTSLTVKFKLTDEDEAVVINEALTSIVDATNGIVSYDFSDADMVAISASMGATTNSATFYGYFIVYSGTEPDTFPVKRRNLEILFQRAN